MTLTEFLKSKGVYEKALVNMKLYGGWGSFSLEERKDLIEKDYGGVSGLFNFSDTMEGLDYWVALDVEFDAIEAGGLK